MKIDWECDKCNQGLNVGEATWCTECSDLYDKKHREEVFVDGFVCQNTDKCDICTEYINSKKKSNKKKFSALWYSVSPPRGDPYKMTDGLSFIKRMEKFFKSVSIEKAVWAFEWKYKGGPLEYYGIHCHCLIFGSQKKLNWHIQRQKEKYFNLNPTNGS